MKGTEQMYKIISMVSPDIPHEFKHVWIYQQWGALLGQTGTINGLIHHDGDAIPDSVETDTTPESIGATYLFDPYDGDTYRLQNIVDWSIYASFGDNEVLARIEGLSFPRQTSPEKDWSKGGSQWDH
jgi:hypothetical protein